MPIEDSHPSRVRLENIKRAILIESIDDTLPSFASQDLAAARRFAQTTLVDIREGNNRDLEGQFRAKIAELGIELDETP